MRRLARGARGCVAREWRGHIPRRERLYRQSRTAIGGILAAALASMLRRLLFAGAFGHGQFAFGSSVLAERIEPMAPDFVLVHGRKVGKRSADARDAATVDEKTPRRARETGHVLGIASQAAPPCPSSAGCAASTRRSSARCP